MLLDGIAATLCLGGSMFRKSLLVFASCLALSAFSSGCGDDDDDDKGNNTGGTGGMSSSGGSDNAGGMEAETTTVTGTINYDGDKTGALVVGAHSSFPPSMTNIVGYTLIEEPTFPQEYTIEGLPPAEYFVLSYVAVGMFHVGAGPGDPQGAYVGDGMMPVPVDVPASGATGVDLTLEEK
jgi:hypothetical protein